MLKITSLEKWSCFNFCFPNEGKHFSRRNESISFDRIFWRKSISWECNISPEPASGRLDDLTEGLKARAASRKRETFLLLSCCTDSVVFIQLNSNTNKLKRRVGKYSLSCSQGVPSYVVSELLTTEEVESHPHPPATHLVCEMAKFLSLSQLSLVIYCAYVCAYEHTDPRWDISGHTAHMRQL